LLRRLLAIHLGQSAEAVDQSLKTAGETTQQVEKAIEQAEASIMKVKTILPESEQTLAQLEETSDSINKTLTTLDAFIRQFDEGEDEDDLPSRPFDIREYTQAAAQAGDTIEQLNTLIMNLDEAAEPTRLDQSVDRLFGRLSGIVWQAGLVIVLAGLILIVAAKLIPRRTRPAV